MRIGMVGWFILVAPFSPRLRFSLCWRYANDPGTTALGLPLLPEETPEAALGAVRARFEGGGESRLSCVDFNPKPNTGVDELTAMLAAPPLSFDMPSARPALAWSRCL